MATTTRLLRTSRPLGLGSSSSSSPSSSLYRLELSRSTKTIRCLSKVGIGGDGHEVRKLLVPAVKVSVAASENFVTSKPETKRGGVDDMVASLLANVKNTALLILKVATKRRPWRFHVQMLVARIIIDCRFFTLFAVAGTLVGSVLCFVEGCFFVLESYFHYFHALSHRSSDLGHVVELLIEAIDMFLLGTAMLIFGIGLHVMFVGSKGKGTQLPGSNLFGLFYLKTLRTWVGMKSVAQAKSKMGHAVAMLLQVGVLEKFKSVAVVTGFDLACFAGAIFLSSASIFVSLDLLLVALLYQILASPS
ncbi:uncharacterized protein LOC132279419 [Cornus florida]|uniref:uncharacterized protein LOC132279419 n=1 Tax=Cornus florida TaxID=4283 RepID=UPI0028A192F3|nr:uncharacterized protein LOC132279419 [Cornus florida]